MSNLRIEGKGPHHQINTCPPASPLGTLAKRISAITAPIVLCLSILRKKSLTMPKDMKVTLQTSSFLFPAKPSK